MVQIRMDKIRNEYIRGTAHTELFGDKVREPRVRWFGHVQTTDNGYTGQSMLKRGRPRRRIMELVKEDMQKVGVTEEDARD